MSKIGRQIFLHFQRKINVISTLIHSVETTLLGNFRVQFSSFVPSILYQTRRCLSLLQKLYPLRVLTISYLKECLSFEFMIGDKSCNFVANYRPPSQSLDQFETFSDNFEKTLEIQFTYCSYLKKGLNCLLILCSNVQ